VLINELFQTGRFSKSDVPTKMRTIIAIHDVLVGQTLTILVLLILIGFILWKYLQKSFSHYNSIKI
jgi:hypothetical protein